MPGSVVHPLSRLRALGYSTPVLKQLSRSRLASSNATYEFRRKLFASYCESRLQDPLFSSPALVVDFFVHIGATRHASYSTLTGYRRTIGHVLRLVTDFVPSTCRILSQLMQSCKRSQAVAAKRIPARDLSFVFCLFFVDRTVWTVCFHCPSSWRKLV